MRQPLFFIGLPIGEMLSCKQTSELYFNYETFFFKLGEEDC